MILITPFITFIIAGCVDASDFPNPRHELSSSSSGDIIHHDRQLSSSSSSSSQGGTIDCPASDSTLTLIDRKEERSWEEGGSATPKEGVHIKRRRCRVRFTSSDCTTYDEAGGKLPSEAAVKAAAAPKPVVFIVKLGVGSPFAGDRQIILSKLVNDVAAHGGVQLVLLVDRSQWIKVGHFEDAASAFPPVLAPLVSQYSIADIQRVFPTKPLKPRAESPQTAKARAIGKYYETYSWGWWWQQHRKRQQEAAAAAAAGGGGGGGGGGVEVKRVFVAEDDTVFSGNWAGLLLLIEEGMAKVEATGDAADLIAFREYCTPEKSWIWARWMHEGWANLTTPGQALETWMTLSGFSPKFLDAAVAQQKQGVCVGFIHSFIHSSR